MRKRTFKIFVVILGISISAIVLLFIKNSYDIKKINGETILLHDLKEYEDVPEVYITKIANGKLSILPSGVVGSMSIEENIMQEMNNNYAIVKTESFEIPKKYYEKFSEEFDINSQNYLLNLKDPVTKFSVVEFYAIRELNIGDQEIRAYQRVELENTFVRWYVTY